MYNNRKETTTTVEREDEYKARVHASNISRNWDSLMSFKERTPRPLRGETYESPEVAEVTDPEIIAKVGYIEEADFKPSTTTMQFQESEENDIYEDVNDRKRKNVAEKKTVAKVSEKKRYNIDTKGKMLIAVYALVVATIFSLIILNSRMLKNLDNTIENYSSQVEVLSSQYSQVVDELNHTMSDEEIIRKATEMGMEKA